MISVHRITFDCANVPAVAQFWSGTLGGQIGPGASGDVAVLEVRADAGSLRLAFRKVPGGKFFKNRVHLDLVGWVLARFICVVALVAAVAGTMAAGGLSRSCRAAQAAGRRTSQTVAAMSRTDSASSQPPSIHWKGQNRLPGW
jgi:hypothetical protein